MPADLRIEGADQLRDLSKLLKETGDKALRKELMRGIQRGGKKMKPHVRVAALRELPKKGGLNEFVADAKVSVRTRSGKNAGVRLVGAKKGHDLAAIDRGRLRHPVFGRGWVNQSIEPGWWSKTLPDHADEVRAEIVTALDDVARRLARG